MYWYCETENTVKVRTFNRDTHVDDFWRFLLFRSYVLSELFYNLEFLKYCRETQWKVSNLFAVHTLIAHLELLSFVVKLKVFSSFVQTRKTTRDVDTVSVLPRVPCHWVPGFSLLLRADQSGSLHKAVSKMVHSCMCGCRHRRSLISMCLLCQWWDSESLRS